MNTPKVTETQFLKREAAEAKDAMSMTLSDAGTALRQSLDLPTWADRYPWGTVGAAFSAGLLGALKAGKKKPAPTASAPSDSGQQAAPAASTAQVAGGAGIAAAAVSGLFSSALKFAASQIADGLKAGAVARNRGYNDEPQDDPAPEMGPDYEYLGGTSSHS